MRPTSEPAVRPADVSGEVPAELRREVRLLGDALGQVLTESGGPGLLDDVERLRQATIALRREPDAERRQAVVDLVAGLDLCQAEAVARAFTVYFQLINLAEEHHRIRTLRQRGQGDELIADSLEAAVADISASDGRSDLQRLLAGLRICPVLTAHPTEARRRAVVEALHRVATEVERLDDPRLARAERAELRRRLLEEVSILWRTEQLRSTRPTPLDEVRRVMAVFDETLFRLVPALYRELDRVLGPDDVGTRPPGFPAFLRWGSWVGADRDGNPTVTAEVTRDTMAVHADHVLRGLEAAARRIGRSLTASTGSAPPSPELAGSLRADEARFPAAASAAAARAPDEPHRRRMAVMAERLVATRAGADGAYADVGEFVADLLEVQRSLAAAGATRLAYGELQHLLWQAQTFGFHLAGLEVRQHSEVHERVLAELAPHAVGDLDALAALARDGWPDPPPVRSDAARECLDTFVVMRDLQRRYGAEACCRYVISFTRSAADLLAVRALARLAVPDGELALQLVPLFETRADLSAAVGVLDELLASKDELAHLDADGRRLEVMLGYSDSAKDAGFLAANLALFHAQGELTAWARRNDVVLTLFHGRGGGLGRGGGPTNRAVRGQAPGSVSGRFKVTEQGEVLFTRYRSVPIARRHLEQVTNAVLVASSPSAEAAASLAGSRFADTASRMADASERAYRALVEQDGFGAFFQRVTPNDELSRLPLGSRPARRRSGTDLGSLRAIPWVFAWSQNRCNLPGWYGLGTGLEAVADEPGGMARLRSMYREWPFFTSLIENAELSLVKADPLIARLYLDLGERPDLVAAIEDEFARTAALVLAVAGHRQLLDSRPFLRAAVALRNPYVDALSFLQARCLAELRTGNPDAERAARLDELVLLTVNGVAAGLQNTG